MKIKIKFTLFDGQGGGWLNQYVENINQTKRYKVKNT